MCLVTVCSLGGAGIATFGVVLDGMALIPSDEHLAGERFAGECFRLRLDSEHCERIQEQEATKSPKSSIVPLEADKSLAEPEKSETPGHHLWLRKATAKDKQERMVR